MQVEFVASKGIYLLNHSVGRPFPGAMAHFQEQFFAPWEHSVGDPWNAWMTVFDDFREVLAQLFQSRPGQFCPQVNLSSAFGKILHALPRAPGRDVILLSESDFPSMGFVAQQAERLGYRLRWLPATRDQSEPEVWLDALDDSVQWLLLTHVQSNTGIQVPLGPIVGAARARGIRTVVDAAQSAGILPVNLEVLQPDFLVGSCVKWLCGGPGAGFLWVHADMLPQCAPVDVGWFSHAQPFAFDIHDFKYHPDARRFWGGTPSVAPFILAAYGIRQLLAVGIGQIRAHNLKQTRRIIDALPVGALFSPVVDDKRSGTLIIDCGARQSRLVDELEKRQVRFDRRAFGLRLSPHITTTESEVDQVLEAVNSVA